MNTMLLLPNTDEEIMDTHDEDIIITTREGKIIKVTQISGEHYGLTPVELLGKSVFDLEAKGIFLQQLLLKLWKKEENRDRSNYTLWTKSINYRHSPFQ